MNEIRSSFLKLIATIYMVLRKTWWKQIIKSSPVRLNVTANLSFKFNKYGFIASKLFQSEPLIKYGYGFESRTLKLIENLSKNCKVVFDVGANVGLHSFVFASVVKQSNGTVFAFEPVKSTFSTLSNNIAINNFSECVKAFNIGLSNEKGSFFISVPMEYKSTDNNDVFNSLNFKTTDKDSSAEMIYLSTIDELVISNDIKTIDLIKIDIEGAELLCLQGAKKSLTEFRPIIIFECFEMYCNRYDYTVQDLIIYLTELEYKLYQYEEAQWIAVPKERQDLTLNNIIQFYS